MAENEIITPKENLKANTVADTRAIAAKRGAINAERQAMQTERTLQRKYRRAVRNDDFGGAADISKLLAQTGGSTVGPVIRQAEQERAVAGQRAIDRADQQNKIRAGGTAALMPGDQRPVEPDPANPPAAVNAGNQPGADEVAAQATANLEAKAGAGNGRATKGDANVLKDSQRAAKGGGDGAVNDRDEAPNAIEARAAAPAAQAAEPPPKAFQPDSRQRFIGDLRKSDSFNRKDPNAINKAIERGSQFGISRDQIKAFSKDPTSATPSLRAQAAKDDLAREVEENWNKEVSGREAVIRSKALDLDNGLMSRSARDAFYDEAKPKIKNLRELQIPGYERPASGASNATSYVNPKIERAFSVSRERIASSEQRFEKMRQILA